MKDFSGMPASMNRAPARLDLYQSLTGLVLALFMWTHLLFVSSILISKNAMLWVTEMMEARFLTDAGRGYPVIVSVVGIVVFSLFIVHAGIALRKFPISWRQHRIFRDQMKMMKHGDTNLWYVQFITGFLMFFLGSVHIYIMISHPDKIGPNLSADRFVSEYMWPLYLVLLFCVELHATIGMYRLAVKWGVLDGKNPRATRKRLKMLKNVLTVFFLVIGLLSFGVYVKYGIENQQQGRVGQRHVSGRPSISQAGGVHR